MFWNISVAVILEYDSITYVRLQCIWPGHTLTNQSYIDCKVLVLDIGYSIYYKSDKSIIAG